MSSEKRLELYQATSINKALCTVKKDMVSLSGCQMKVQIKFILTTAVIQFAWSTYHSKTRGILRSVSQGLEHGIASCLCLMTLMLCCLWGNVTSWMEQIGHLLHWLVSLGVKIRGWEHYWSRLPQSVLVGGWPCPNLINSNWVSHWMTCDDRQLLCVAQNFIGKLFMLQDKLTICVSVGVMDVRT